MPSLKERQHQLREEAIVEAAHDLLIHQGYNALNMDELAAQVGISKATLYQHFSSKDELVVQAVLAHMKQGEEKVKELMAGLTPIETLEHVVRYSVSRRISLSVAHFELPQHLREDPRIQEQRSNYVNFLGSIIEQGKADGTIRTDLSVPVVIGTFFTIFSHAHQELLRDQIVSPEEMVETLVTTFLSGIRMH